MKGRVAVLKQYHPPIEIEEVEVPALEPGAILVKATMAGVCGSDLHTWRGDQAARALPPSGSALGHEGIGVVYGLRPGVRTDSAGNHSGRATGSSTPRRSPVTALDSA